MGVLRLVDLLFPKCSKCEKNHGGKYLVVRVLSLDVVRWSTNFLNVLVLQKKQERGIFKAKLLKEDKLKKVVANTIIASMYFMLGKMFRILLMWLKVCCRSLNLMHMFCLI